MALDVRALSERDVTGVGRYVQALLAAFKGNRLVNVTPSNSSGPRLIGPQLIWPLRLRLDAIRLVHGPANALPLLPLGPPGVVTIHDLAIYEHPEWFPSGQWFSTRVVVPRSAHRARIVICPSEATKRAVVRILGVDEARCRVIPHGVEAEFALPVSPQVRADVRGRYRLPPRYLLQVGTVQPRKNYVTTLRALARLPADQRIPLVAVGTFGWKFEPVLDAIRELDLSDWVRFVGYAGLEDLPALYQMATAVAFPSLDEGFGFPLLEAFAAGAPVVASNAGAIPEVAGDAALLCAPQDEKTMANHLLRLLTNHGLRERQVAAGRVRAALYTWATSAAAHQAVYEAVA